MNKYALILSVFILLFIIATTIFFNLGQTREYTYAGATFVFFFSHEDAFNHYLYAKSFDVQNYAPLFPLIAGPFTSTPSTFFYFVSIIIFLLIPLFLCWLLKNNWVIFFYFAFALPFQVDLYATYPSFILSVWVLALFIKQDWKLFVVSIPLSILLHSWGIFLVTVSFLVFLLLKYKETVVALACVPILNKNPSSEIKEPIFGFAASFVKSTITYWDDFVRNFTRNINFVFVLCAFKSFFDRKRFDLIVISLLLFVLGLFSWRFWMFLSLFILLGFTWFFEGLSKKWKAFFVLFGLAFILLHLITWFFDKKSLITGNC